MQDAQGPAAAAESFVTQALAQLQAQQGLPVTQMGAKTPRQFIHSASACLAQYPLQHSPVHLANGRKSPVRFTNGSQSFVQYLLAKTVAGASAESRMLMQELRLAATLGGGFCNLLLPEGLSVLRFLSEPAPTQNNHISYLHSKQSAG